MSNNNSNLNSLIFISEMKELSDIDSTCITGGNRAIFGGGIPRIGSTTFSTRYTTSTKFNDISIKMTSNPYDLYVKAVRADGKGDVSSFSRFIPANYKGLITVASNVRDGTRFKLNFNAPTLKSFNIAGRMTF